MVLSASGSTFYSTASSTMATHTNPSKEGSTPLVSEEIMKHFKENMFCNSYFSSNTPPKAFEKVDEIFTNDTSQANQNNDEMQAYVQELIKYNKQLSNPIIQAEILNKKGLFGADKGFIEKSYQALYFLGAYISELYDIKIDVQGKVTSCTKRTFTAENLESCLEATKNLQDVKNGLTSKTSTKLPPKTADENNFLSERNSEGSAQQNKKGEGLALGGHETKDVFYRILSPRDPRESAGVVLFAAGDAAPIFKGTSEIQTLDFKDRKICEGFELLACSIVMTIGFRLMTTSDSDMGYKCELQEMLLTHIYSSIAVNELENFSQETCQKIETFIPKNKKRTDPFIGEGRILSSTDAINLVKSLLKKEGSYTYQQISDKLNQLTNIYRENREYQVDLGNQARRKKLYDLLNTKVIKNDDNKNWGTLFRHLALKLDAAGQERLLTELKEENGNLFNLGIKRTNFINDLFGGRDSTTINSAEYNQILSSATHHVYNIMKTTDWGDRLDETKVFNNLILDICTSKLKTQQQGFLLKRLQDALNENFHGEFAAGKKKRSSLGRSIANASFYTITYYSQFALSFIPAVREGLAAAKVGVAAAKLVTGAIEATAFGFLSYGAHQGRTRSYTNKRDAVKKEMAKIPKELEENNTDLENKYEEFLDAYKQLKLLKKKSSKDVNSVELNRLLAVIKDCSEYFKNNNTYELMFESNHGEKKCTLFQIVSTVLDKDLLKKVNKNNEGGGTTEQLQLLEENTRTFVNELLTTLYKDKVLKEVEDTLGITSIDNITEDQFNIYMSQGALKAKDKSAKELTLFALKCSILLDLMKESSEEPGLTATERQKRRATYEGSKTNYSDVIKRAAEDKSSLFFGTQRRNSETYTFRKMEGRFGANIFTLGLLGFVIAVTGFGPTAPLGLMGLGFLIAFTGGLDMALRKSFESLEFSTRVESKTLKGIVKILNLLGKALVALFECLGLEKWIPEFSFNDLLKAHSNYETIRSVVDANDKAPSNINNKRTLTAKEVLENIAKADFNAKRMLEELNKCLTEREIRNDQLKIDNINDVAGTAGAYYGGPERIVALREEVNLLYKQGVDKESVCLTQVRAQRLIMSCNISANEKRILLSEVAYYCCIKGDLAQILQTKNMIGSMQGLGVDFALGFVLFLPGILAPIPGLENIFGRPGEAMNALLAARKFSIQLACSTIAIGGWIHTLDISREGRTKSMQTALKANKKILALYTAEQIQSDYEIERRSLCAQEKQKLKERYLYGTDAVRAILGIQRNKIRTGRKTESIRKYTEPKIHEPALAY